MKLAGPISITFVLFAMYSHAFAGSTPPKSSPHTNAPSEIQIDVVAQAKEEIRQTTLLWDPVFYYSVFGVYKVGGKAALYGGAYVLLESPKLTIDLVNGGFFKTLTDVGKDFFLDLIETAVETPSKTCQNISNQLVYNGWDDYQIAYEIVKKARSKKSLSEEDAKEFMKRRWGVRKLMIARTLYNETIDTKYSISKVVAKKVIRELVDKFDREYQQSLGIENKLPITKSAFFIKDVIDILKDKKVGLMAYAPYQKFLQQMEILNEAMISESTDVTPTSVSINANEQSKTPNKQPTSNARTISDGLIAYYPFDGDASDASGNGNNGQVFGPKLTTDRFNAANRAYGFNGSTDFIRVLNSPMLNPAYFTLAAWVYYQNGAYNAHAINKSTQIDFFIETSIGSTLGCHIKDTPFRSGSVVSRNQWTFIAVTMGPEVIKIYRNGSVVGSWPSSGALIATPADWTFGSRGGATNTAFQGKIDDIRFYNRPLSESEIKILYNQIR